MGPVVSVVTSILLLVGFFVALLVFVTVSGLVVLSVLGSIFRLVNKVNEYKVIPKKK